MLVNTKPGGYKEQEKAVSLYMCVCALVSETQYTILWKLNSEKHKKYLKKCLKKAHIVKLSRVKLLPEEGGQVIQVSQECSSVCLGISETFCQRASSPNNPPPTKHDGKRKQEAFLACDTSCAGGV